MAIKVANEVPCNARWSMKFILLISVCSFLQNTCKDPVEFNLQFNTWKECAVAALETSKKYLDLEDEKIINKYQLATKFSCEEIKET